MTSLLNSIWHKYNINRNEKLFLIFSKKSFTELLFYQVKKLMIKALERKFPVDKIHTISSTPEALNMSKIFFVDKDIYIYINI